AVTTIETAIIGLVGTAPDAGQATAATLISGTPLLDNELTITSKIAGRVGNTVTVTAALPPPAENPVAVATTAVWQNGALVITLGCDDSGRVNA
ncbi:phage tail protein, partial [Escherichia coli]